MDRNEIEEKDLRLVKKIRTIVQQKEKSSTHKKTFWKMPGFWLPTVCVALIAMALVVYNQISPNAVQDGAAQPATVKENIANTVEKRSDEKVAPIELADTKDVIAAADVDEKGNSAADNDGVESESASMAPSIESNAPQESAPDFSDVADQPTVASIPAEKRGVSTDIFISHLVSCGGVRDKQFVSAKSTFSLAQDPIAMVWMRVLSKTPPLTLKHVYYLNGQHYCDVPLDIPYPHMRTWSKVSINLESHIGKWHVDVVSESGEKLDQIEFTVVP